MDHRVEIKHLDIPRLLHSQDKSTMDYLKRIPGFKNVVDKTVGDVMERYAAIEYSAEGVDVTQKSMPVIYKQVNDVCRILGMKDIPRCSIDWLYNISSFSVGEKNRRIVLQSGSVDLLTTEELNFLIGHEIGHMLCGHKTYHMLMEAIYRPAVSHDLRAWMSLIKLPLLKWYRISDFSADRVGLLCCQDINVALSAMIKMAGLPKKYYNRVHLPSFIQQAKKFSEDYSGIMDSVIRYMSINAGYKPWLVSRASELIKWCDSNEYNRILVSNNN